MDTLGSLCDKLTVLKLKQYHNDDKKRAELLAMQEWRLSSEIDAYIANAIRGSIALDDMICPTTKIYKKEGNEIPEVVGGIGLVFAELAMVNCKIWHEQEKAYEFEKVPADKKDAVVKQLAVLNLTRSRCVDSIDFQFQRLVK